MYAFKILSSELKGRFDPRFYNPYHKEIMKKIKERGRQKDIEIKQLGDIALPKTSAFYSAIAESYGDVGIPFIRVSDVRTFSISPTDLIRIPKKIAEENPSIASLQSGDLVITKGGTVGNVAIVPKWMPECKICRDIIGLKIIGDADPNYIVLYLASKYGQIQFERMRTQQIQSHLTIEPLKDIKILIPKSQEKEIARMIAKANELGGMALKLLDESKDYLYKKLDLTPSNFKDVIAFSIKRKNIGDMLTPKYFYPKFVKCVKKALDKKEMIELGQISEIEAGIEIGSKFYQKEGVPFIRTSDIISNEIDLYPQHYLSEEIYEKNKPDIKEGDIIFTKDGIIGLSGMVVKEDKCILASGVANIRIINEIDRFYIFQILNSIVGVYQAEQRSVVASTIPHLNIERLKEIKIPLVDERSIQKISKKIQQVFNLKNERKTLIRKAIIKLDESLM